MRDDLAAPGPWLPTGDAGPSTARGSNDFAFSTLLMSASYDKDKGFHYRLHFWFEVGILSLSFLLQMGYWVWRQYRTRVQAARRKKDDTSRADASTWYVLAGRARLLWCKLMLSDKANAISAIQTLRNVMMGTSVRAGGRNYLLSIYDFI